MELLPMAIWIVSMRSGLALPSISCSNDVAIPANLMARKPDNMNANHPIHISKSAIAALTLPLAPSATWRVIAMGAPQRRARKAARTSFWVKAES
jgi:hypothetical protein